MAAKKATKKKAISVAADVEVPATAPLHDLLAEPIFGVRFTDERRETLSLPGLLAALGRSREGEEVASFTALQAHQTHPWHAFLVQLAAVALHHAGEAKPALDEAAWRQRLLAVTEGAREPWCLVVGDLAKPAFMQPPVPEGTVEAFKTGYASPDELDILVTAKNHDVKANRISAARPEHWVFALVSLQTMQGFSGRANYGVARMKDVYASRPSIAMAPSLSEGVRFRRELGLLLEARSALVEKHGYPQSGGVALLWTVPWQGGKSETIALQACDPLFIEVCRRVRLSEAAGVLSGRATGTEAKRIEAGELKGDTGDPWTPVHRTEPGAYRPRKSGFQYEEAVQLLLGDDYEPSLAQRATAADPKVMWLSLWAFVRGQGRTEGLHERLISLPARMRQVGLRDRLAALAKRRVASAAQASGDVLRPALKVLLQGAPEKLKMEDDRPQRWTQAFTRSVDDIFFEALFADVELPPEEADRSFEQRLVALARAQFEKAIGAAPIPAARRYRAIAAGERVFSGCAHKVFPNLFETAVKPEPQQEA